MFDMTVNLGSLLTIASFLVIVTIYIVSGRTGTKVLDTRLEMIDAQMEDFKLEMKKLADVIITQVTQSGRMDRIEDRQLAEGRRVDEIARRMNIIADSPTR